MLLDDLFIVKNGVAKSNLNVFDCKQTDSIPFIRPASTQQRTIDGWVRRSEVKPEKIFPSQTLFTSTDGEGSHTYSYVSNFEFVPNSNVSVLIPKRPMSLEQKIYYAGCITMNRRKFSFGRKPKGDRLRKLQLPLLVPNWVKLNDDDFSSMVLGRLVTLSGESHGSKSMAICCEPTTVGNLFDIAYGTSLELVRLQQDPEGINFISRTAKNNGVSARVKRIPEIPPIEAPALTVALGGSVLESFVQIEPFYAGFHIYCLKPKTNMTLEEMLFYCMCIRANQFRYSYGRQANRTLGKLCIPAPESIPFWVYGSIRMVAAQMLGEIRNG
jgi:hypothetical protein